MTPTVASRANAAGDYLVRRQARGVVIGTVTPVRRYNWLAHCNCGRILVIGAWDRESAAGELSRHFEAEHGSPPEDVR